MRSHTIGAILFVLFTMILVSIPAFAHPHGNFHQNYGHAHYVHPNYGHPVYGGAHYANPYGYAPTAYPYPATYPVYNNYAYRGYAPPTGYGYYPAGHTARNLAIGSSIGAGVGAAVGLLASHHGHRYY